MEIQSSIFPISMQTNLNLILDKYIRYIFHNLSNHLRNFASKKKNAQFSNNHFLKIYHDILNQKFL